jgi:sterol desaturase/sphingolipid hydroxylase (fatty acid hydroxylase superfamily)
VPIIDLLGPLDPFRSASSSLYVPFLVIAFAVAFAVTKLRIADWSGAVTRRTLLHRSSLHDVAMFVVEGILVVPLLAWLLSSIALGRFVHQRVTGLVGDHDLVTGWPAAVVVTAVAFLAIDFANFFVHYLQHRYSWLWRFHAVHHSAPVLNPITAYRNHPVDQLGKALMVLLVLDVSRGIMFAFVETRPAVSALGYNVGFVVGLSLLSAFRHSHAWVSFGRRIELVLASPAQHLIHHSVDPRDHDRNFGAFLSIWDRLFGTLVTAETRRPITFGLDGHHAGRYGTFASLYLEPLRRRGAGTGPNDPVDITRTSHPEDSPMAS